MRLAFSLLLIVFAGSLLSTQSSCSKKKTETAPSSPAPAGNGTWTFGDRSYKSDSATFVGSPRFIYGFREVFDYNREIDIIFRQRPDTGSYTIHPSSNGNWKQEDLTDTECMVSVSFTLNGGVYLSSETEPQKIIVRKVDEFYKIHIPHLTLHRSDDPKQTITIKGDFFTLRNGDSPSGSFTENGARVETFFNGSYAICGYTWRFVQSNNSRVFLTLHEKPVSSGIYTFALYCDQQGAEMNVELYNTSENLWRKYRSSSARPGTLEVKKTVEGFDVCITNYPWLLKVNPPLPPRDTGNFSGNFNIKL